MNILKDEKIASLNAEERERIFPLISIGKRVGGGGFSLAWFGLDFFFSLF